MSNVPLVDLAWQHARVAPAVAAGFDEVLAKTAFIEGPGVAAFEEEFAAFSGARRCVGVANGTDAIELALRALDVGTGDEVILPANTFIATAEAVVRAGATPVLVDCDEHHLVDTEQVKAARTGRTRAVIGVHLYGQMAPLERLEGWAADTGVHLLEDAAQSQGATRNGRGMGGLSRIAATSFYPGKNLGAYGDAGAVVTNDEELADRVALIRNHGSSVRYRHEVLGVNSRLDTLQAVVLRAKLEHLTEWNELRGKAAARYGELLAEAPGLELPTVLDGNVHVWHLYVVRVPHRDEVLAALQEQRIGAGIHYPVPVHLHPAFAFLARGRGAFPAAEAACDSILSLPLFPGITDEQLVRVAEALRAALGGS